MLEKKQIVTIVLLDTEPSTQGLKNIRGRENNRDKKVKVMAVMIYFIIENDREIYTTFYDKN